MKQYPDTLILMVGPNCTPNYISAEMLRPKRIMLVFSRETEDAKDRLKNVFQHKGLAVLECFLEDAYCATDIRRDVIRALREYGIPRGPGLHLNYTGGTKAMAVHAYEAWREYAGSDGLASYVSSTESKLNYSDGTFDMVDVDLDFETLCRLQGIKQAYAPYDAAKNGCPKEDFEIAKKAIVKPEEKPNQGFWLEKWVACQMVQVLPEGSEVLVNFTSIMGNRGFEVDVFAIRGHRPFVISCATSRHIEICKQKVFEVAFRANQLCGEWARPALVCLDVRSDEGVDLTDALQTDVKGMWNSPNVPKIFGQKHLIQWLGWDGPPDRSSLKEWVED